MQKNSIDLKEKLKKEYCYKIELHAHTSPASSCGEASPEQLVKIYKDLGYDALVLTNHFISDYVSFKDKSLSKDEHLKIYLDDYVKTKEAGDRCGLKVLLGAELRFIQNSNDYLLYGTDYGILSKAYDYLKIGLKEFREEVKLENSVLIQAHPFRQGIELVDSKLLDGIETFNMHPGHNGAIGFAARYAKEQGFSITTAGSDFHHLGLGHEGVAAIRTKKLPKDSFELAEILKSGDYVFEIGDNSIVIP